MKTLNDFINERLSISNSTAFKTNIIECISKMYEENILSTGISREHSGYFYLTHGEEKKRKYILHEIKFPYNESKLIPQYKIDGKKPVQLDYDALIETLNSKPYWSMKLVVNSHEMLKIVQNAFDKFKDCMKSWYCSEEMGINLIANNVQTDKLEQLIEEIAKV